MTEVKEQPEARTGAQREKLHALPYDLVPFQEITDAYARVAEHGAQKYEPWNWTKGLPRVQLLGSLLRHTFAYLRGEARDRDSGLSHADHILWNAAALVHNEAHGGEDGRRPDPRWPGVCKEQLASLDRFELAALSEKEADRLRETMSLSVNQRLVPRHDRPLDCTAPMGPLGKVTCLTRHEK
ncbi:MAG: dATP/dGTP diphosphohydrolase domain-containing protein [Pseudomonadota bacterium]